MRLFLLIVPSLLMGCTAYNSQALLDAEFLSRSGMKFQFSTPVSILANVSTKITVEAKNGNGITIPNFSGAVQFSAIGSGILVVTSESPFLMGKKEVYVKYVKSLNVGQTEMISLRAQAADDASVTGASNALLAVAATFKVTVPANITAGTPFSITVAAQGGDGSAYSDYNGTVTLGLDQGIGALSQTTLSGFVGGVATASVSFTGTVGPVKFRASDGLTAAFYGASSEVTVGMGTGDSYVLNFIAYPTSASKVRLSWNKVPDAVGYNLYRKNAGSWSLISGSPFSGFLYEDTGLTSGTTYDYKIEALKSVTLEVLNTASAAAAPALAPCGATVSGNITTGVVNWLKSQSPICVTTPVSITNATLIIQAGTQLLFSVGAYLDVGAGGQLQAAGSASDLIIMTASADFSVLANRWGKAGNGEAITFSSLTGFGTTFTVDGNYNYSSGSVIDYVLIEGSGRGIENSGNLSLLVDHSIFRNIELKQNAGANGIGVNFTNGGVSGYTATAVVRNSVFNHLRSNFASSVKGNAVYAFYASAAPYILIKNNMFIANASAGTGSVAGALWLQGDTNTSNYCEASGNYFFKNSVPNQDGGAMAHNYANGTNIVRKNIFYQNSAGVASYGGGALYLSSQSANTTIDANIFRQNTAPSGAQGGGAIAAYYAASTTIKNNLFENNSALNGKGGAVLLAAGGNPNVLLQRNTFTGNAAANGAAFALSDLSASNAIFEYNYVASQTATTAGAAIHATSAGGASTVISAIRFNSFDGGTLSPTALYNVEDTAYTITGNWWGQVVTNGSACSANATLCTSTGFNQILNANQISAPVLCKVNSADSSCVGSPY